MGRMIELLSRSNVHASAVSCPHITFTLKADPLAGILQVGVGTCGFDKTNIFS